MNHKCSDVKLSGQPITVQEKQKQNNHSTICTFGFNLKNIVFHFLNDTSYCNTGIKILETNENSTALSRLIWALIYASSFVTTSRNATCQHHLVTVQVQI